MFEYITREDYEIALKDKCNLFYEQANDESDLIEKNRKLAICQGLSIAQDLLYNAAEENLECL